MRFYSSSGDDFADEIKKAHDEGKYLGRIDLDIAGSRILQTVRNKMLQNNPSLHKVDNARTVMAEHRTRVAEKIMDEGECYVSDCVFRDTKGQIIDVNLKELQERNNVNLHDSGYQDAYRALFYGIDHGLVTCQFPNGKTFDVSSVRDEYTKNSAYYDSMGKDIAKYESDMFSETNELYKKMSSSGGPTSVTGYVKDERERIQFESDLGEFLEETYDNSLDRLSKYESGDNPDLLVLEGGFNMDESSKNVKKLGDKTSFDDSDVFENDTEQPEPEQYDNVETEMYEEQTPKDLSAAPKKHSFFSFSEENDEEFVSKYDDNLKLLIEAMKSYLQPQEYAPENLNVNVAEVSDDVSDSFGSYFSTVNDYLATEHARGNYDPTLDTKAVTNSMIPDVRTEMLEKNPELAAVDTAVTERANHYVNVQNELMSQGNCVLADCKFKDKDGKPLDIDWQGLAKSGKGYSEAYDALYYGLDHGMISCEMPNGQSFDMSKIQDGYVDNLAHYDSMSKEMDQHAANIYAETKKKYMEMSPEERAALTPDYITDPDKRKQFEADVEKDMQGTMDNYSREVAGYENGGNPYESFLKSHTVGNTGKEQALQAQQQSAGLAGNGAVKDSNESQKTQQNESITVTTCNVEKRTDAKTKEDYFAVAFPAPSDVDAKFVYVRVPKENVEPTGHKNGNGKESYNVKFDSPVQDAMYKTNKNEAPRKVKFDVGEYQAKQESKTRDASKFADNDFESSKKDNQNECSSK